MKYTPIYVSHIQQKNNIENLKKYMNDRGWNVSVFARELEISRGTLDSVLKNHSHGSFKLWNLLTEKTGIKMEYTLVEGEKEKERKKEASKSSTFIPEHVIPMLKMHGNTVIRNSLIRKHKQEGVLEELKKLGFGNINIKRTENDIYILEKG